MKKRYAAIFAIAALAVPVGLAEATDGTTTGKCPPGSWINVRVDQPNGDVSTTQLHADLPDGYSMVGGSSGGERVVINADGTVKARGGKVTIECIAPTH